jgi:pimeloyl-ACP methyl ester carboxylesterase
MQQKIYLDGPFGQIHIHQWGQGASCIVCLAPSPYSGVAYNTLAPYLAANHRVIAMDYPGYGQSSPTPSTPTIGDFADAALAVADAVSPEHPVIMLGFHTGTLVAVEASIRQPSRVRHNVLVDVPFFDPAKRGELLIKMGSVRELTPNLSMLAPDWNFSVAKRLEHVPLARGYELFVDQISAGERANAAFHAAFSYPCEEQLAAVSRPTLVVATRAGLHAQSMAAARHIPSSTLIELNDVDVAVLEKGAAIVAQTALQWLGE